VATVNEEAPSAPRPDAPDVEPAVDPARLDALAGQLVWRIGRSSDDGPVTVRVGLASAAAAFADLPKLRSASDAELRDAIDAGELRVEWVGSGR
jgi:hypothetical protein